MIGTPRGDRRIEHLSEGDLVLTVDDGPQPIRWIGSTSVRATGGLAPVRFARGTLGNDRDLFVSPLHRMLVRTPTSNKGEVLVPAIDLVDNFRATVAYGGMVTYHHFMFDRHQMVLANGLPSESFNPAEYGLACLDDAARDRLLARFPRLRSGLANYGAPRRPLLNGQKATG